MARFLLLISPVFAAASPVLAGEERATINVSLRVEPFCAARPTPPAQSTATPATIDCAVDPQRTERGPERAPPYTVRTLRKAEGTVVSFDF